MIARQISSRRSFVLVAVLIIVTSAVLVATSLLFVAQGRAGDVAGSADMVQSRALAWSGVRAVMTILNDQRDRLLKSEPPTLDPQYVIYENASRAGVIRLLPMTADGQTLFACEAGKLDLNSVDAQSIANTNLVDLATADEIIKYREQSPGHALQSVAKLLFVPGAGITAEKLYGPIDQIKPRDQAQLDRGDLAQRVQNRLAPAQVRGLADVVTVYSIEPNVQHDGTPRVNLNVPWSDALAQKVTQRFGKESADRLKKFFDDGVKFDSDAKIVQALLDSKIPPKDWRDPLDFFTSSPDATLFGRLDINTASAEALVGLPGITTEQAAQMVSVRQELASDDRTSIAWPVTAQIISGDQLTQIADKITTRCFAFRVRIAAGETAADQLDGPLDHPMIFEAVIDLSDAQPPGGRVAYLRDISVLQAVAKIAQDSSSNQSPTPFDIEAQDDVPPSSAPDDAATAENAPAQTMPADEETQNDSETADAATAGDDASPAASPTSASSKPAPHQRIGRWRIGS